MEVIIKNLFEKLFKSCRDPKTKTLKKRKVKMQTIINNNPNKEDKMVFLSIVTGCILVDIVLVSVAVGTGDCIGWFGGKQIYSKED